MVKTNATLKADSYSTLHRSTVKMVFAVVHAKTATAARIRVCRSTRRHALPVRPTRTSSGSTGPARRATRRSTCSAAARVTIATAANDSPACSIRPSARTTSHQSRVKSPWWQRRRRVNKRQLNANSKNNLPARVNRQPPKQPILIITVYFIIHHCKLKFASVILILDIILKKTLFKYSNNSIRFKTKVVVENIDHRNSVCDCYHADREHRHVE